MTHNQPAQNELNTLLSLDMYKWRLNRHAVEKREENVNRELLRRQHTN